MAVLREAFGTWAIQASDRVDEVVFPPVGVVAGRCLRHLPDVVWQTGQDLLRAEHHEVGVARRPDVPVRLVEAEELKDQRRRAPFLQEEDERTPHGRAPRASSTEAAAAACSTKAAAHRSRVRFSRT